MQQSNLFKENTEMLEQIYEQCKEIQEIFEISLDEALILMHQQNWISDRAMDFMTAEKPIQIIIKKSSQIICEICYVDQIQVRLQCNHGVCLSCFGQYLDEQLKAGAFVKCFGDSCQLFIPHSLILKNYKDQQRYLKQLMRSYTKSNQMIRMCNKVGCNYYTDCPFKFDVQFIECKCGEIFCIKCSNGDHQPCNCKQAEDWLKQQAINKDTYKFIQEKTKFCPKCRQPIEKNQGCNHMTCKKPLGCGHEFCWICEGPWSEHSGETGGFYRCNKFEDNESQKKKSNINKDKSVTERLVFYTIRYQAHEKGLKIALKQFSKFERKVQEFQEKYCTMNFQYLKESYQFLYKARNTMKWTYAFGYYLSISNREKLPLFEFNQADLERRCEALHYMLEVKLNDYEIEVLKQRVLTLMNQAQTFLKNFLKEIDNILKVKN